MDVEVVEVVVVEVEVVEVEEVVVDSSEGKRGAALVSTPWLVSSLNCWNMSNTLAPGTSLAVRNTRLEAVSTPNLTAWTTSVSAISPHLSLTRGRKAGRWRRRW